MARRPGLRRMTSDWADSQRARFGAGSSQLIMIESAVRLARFADDAERDNDRRLWLALTKDLRQLIKDVERDSGGGGGPAAGDGDAWAAEMARLVGAPPSLGNATDDL